MLFAVVVLSLSLFAGKAVHIDDPLFIWMAQQIARSPFDPFGFSVNWFGVEESAIEVMKNPPLASYYLAAVGASCGWDETTLHLAFILPALALLLGVYRLALRLTVPPFESALLVFFSPAVFVSSTALMPDVMMTAFWVWALVFWIAGVDHGRRRDLLLGAVAAALASLTKYFGFAVVPVMLAYSLIKEGTGGRSAAYLLLPFLLMIAYNAATDAIYGRPMLADAFSYARLGQEVMREGPWRAPTTLAFIGGCAGVAFVLPSLLAQRRLLVWLAGVSVFMTAVPVFFSNIVWGGDPFWLETAVQFVVWCAVGGFIMLLPVIPLVEDRSAETRLLALWIFGVFVFTAFLNWSVNAKTILPLVPPLVILVLRERERLRKRSASRFQTIVPLALSALMGFVIAWGDLSIANSARKSIEEIRKIIPAHVPAERVWFQGHWGFQYYMQQAGYHAQTLSQLDLKGADVLVIPAKNTNLFGVEKEKVTSHTILNIPLKTLATTVDPARKAGFYTDFMGYLPFAIGRVPDEKYYILFLTE